MYKISVDKDQYHPIIFLDAVTIIPGLTEGSTSVDVDNQKRWVDEFNMAYSSVADLKKVPIPNDSGGTTNVVSVVVPAFSKSDGEITKMTKKEYNDFAKAVVQQWKSIFGLSSSQIKIFWPDLIKNIRITK